MRAKSDVVRVNLDIFRLEPEIDQLLLSFTSELERVGNSEEKVSFVEMNLVAALGSLVDEDLESFDQLVEGRGQVDIVKEEDCDSKTTAN